ncbi:hypothetical protein [Chryseolinea lacunae]|uniref:Tetratricopeptide repeat protein n=1 Tax=Chryseolinea lacunae TaxID=2801331 RepID=A0ABS1KV51_9BACT|nr:hypothetical protein [Chryseolinea lacunae]MBL0743183.1 hypothetical protein [Chryseolinea lacunae]
MTKAVLIIVLSCLSFAFVKERGPVRFFLPGESNIYPDSFAIYWTCPNKAWVETHGQPEVHIRFMNIYGDELFRTPTVKDSIVTFPFNHFNERTLIVSSTTATPKTSDYDSYGLRILTKRPAIEEMKVVLSFDPSVANYRNLARVYEKERCFVNAIFLYRQMIKMDPEAIRDWQAFKERNQKKFSRPEAPIKK